jgi:uncharacterized repeat protein (TIGR01451 family)
MVLSPTSRLIVLIGFAVLLATSPGFSNTGSADEPPEGLSPGDWAQIRDQVELLLPTPDPDVEDGARFGHSVAFDGDTAVVGTPDEDYLTDPDHGAAYVFVRSGSTWIQQAKLVPTLSSAVGGHTGTSVAIAGDLVLIGAPGADGGEGRAYTFTRTGTTWQYAAEISASDAAAGDNFGVSVALDNTTAVVGADLGDHAGGVDAGAAYVFIWSGTSWDQQAKLTASDGAADDRFGISVAISTDTAIVGAMRHDHVIGNAGAAYVYVRSGTTWTEQAELLADDLAFNDYFGGSVSIDGDTAIIGADFDNQPLSNAGSAYVFVRSGTTWTQQAKLVAGDAGVGDRFGSSVSIDGDTVAVGAMDQASPGAAYIFVRSGTVWSEQSQLIGSGIAGSAQMGYSVSVSGDAVLVGAPRDDHHAVDVGSAWFYTRTGTTWTEQQKLIPTDGAKNDKFGYSVAFSGDTVVVGASEDSHAAGIGAGSVYVFISSGDTWSEQAKLVAGDAAGSDLFGVSVAIDGDTLVVGAPGYDDGGTSYGSAYVFVRSGSTWTEQQKLVHFAEEYDDFGSAVAIDGDSVVVGAPHYDDTGITGSAYIFVRSGTVWSEQQKLVDGGWPNYLLGYSVAIDGDTAIVGAVRFPTTGAAFVFVRSGTSWSNQWTLVPSDGALNDSFGHSVAIDNDTVVVSATGSDSPGATNVGSAYVYVRSGVVWAEQQKLVAPDVVSNSSFGESVSIDGDVAVITRIGAAYPFLRTGTTWLRQPAIVGEDVGDQDDFGRSVVIRDRRVVVGAPDDDGIADSTGSATVVRSNLADLAIAKDDGQNTAIAGLPVTYTITASNPVGPDDTIGVSVNDVFPPELSGCSWSCTPSGGASCTASGLGDISDTVDLPVGGVASYAATCTVSPSATGTLSNTVQIDDPNTWDPDFVNNSATDVDNLTTLADLWISKTDGQTTAAPGGQVVYTITATNDGPSDVLGATVIDAFPGELSCVWTCAPSGGATCSSGGVGTFSDSVNLPVDGAAVYTVTCDIDAGATGTLSNTAALVTPAGVIDPTPGNNSATDVDTLIPETDLSVTKTNRRTEIVETFDYPYTITVTNSGPHDAMGATVSDNFPAELTDCSWTCAPTVGATCTASGAGSINDLADLPTGAAVVYTATCTVAASSGTCSNTATITAPAGISDPNPGNNSATDADHVTALADWIFGDGFESGGVAAWSN